MNGVGVLLDEIKINMMHAYKQATMKPFLEGGIGVEIETKTKFMVATFLIVTIKNTEV